MKTDSCLLALSITLACGCTLDHRLQYMRAKLAPSDLNCTFGLFERRAKKQIEAHNALGCKAYLESLECTD
jgi:hypothetical protein